MEPDDRGRPSKLSVKGFFSNLRHRRSRSRSVIPSSNTESPDAKTTSEKPEPPASPALEADRKVTEVPFLKPAIENTELAQAGTSPGTAQQESRDDVPDIAVSTNTKPTGLQAAPALDSLSVEQHRSALWQEAYEELSGEQETLMTTYETVLMDQASIPKDSEGPVTNQLAMVAKVQKQRIENRQWQFQWFGHQQSVRDTIDRILNITQKSAGLISVGMSQAPPYISIPWSAITALIPLMMNELKEHKACVAGLEIVARLTFSYQMAEEAFLGPNDTRDVYKKSVMRLYKAILEYQALSIRYFGRSTLKRIGINIGKASTQWADMPEILSKMDNETRHSLNSLGQRKSVSALIAIHDILNRQQSEIKSLVQNARAKGDEIAEITGWASLVTVEIDHRDVRQKLGESHYSSGRWLLEHSLLQRWGQWKGDCHCFWLRGGVGSGKSSLVSILVEDLVRSPDGIVAFFYCSRKSDKHKDERATARNDPDNALRSLVAQTAVSEDGKKIFDELVQCFDKDQRGLYKGLGLSRTECVEMLDSIFNESHGQKFTIIIDALDECKDHDSLLSCLKEATRSNGNVRLFFSSRFEVNVQDSEYFPEATCLDVGEQNTGDIQEFLKIEIPKRRPGSGITATQELRLSDAIMQRAGGMFMWVKLQVNLFLAEIRSERIRFEADIETKLESLESSKTVGEELLYGAYGEVYRKAIGNDQQTRKEIVTTALQWVLCAFRTLTLRELAFATAVKGDGTFTPGIQEGLVMELCSNLLIEDTTGAIRIAHLSVRHFLEAQASSEFLPQVANLQAALTCLYFLKSPYFKEFETSDAEVLKPKDANVTLTKGFRVYVASNWSRHCREARKDQDLQDLMSSISANTSSSLPRRPTNLHEPTVASTTDSTDHDLFIDFYQRVNSDTSAATSFIEQFIALGGDLEARSDTGTTLLHECIRLQLDSLSKLLLDSGADFDARDSHGNTPLHIAAMHYGNRGIQLLLLAGADKNATNLAVQTPLHVAVAFSCLEVAETLLSVNVRGLEKDIRGDSPMHYAAAMGAAVFVESLLLSGYSPNGENASGQTALTLAIRLRNVEVIKLLLDHKATISESDVMEAMNSEIPAVQELVSQRDLRTVVDEPVDTPEDCYRAEFGDKDALPCSFCDIARWVTASRKGTTYRHHPSFESLEDSAKKGCPMCNLFLNDLDEPSVAGDPFMVTLEPCSAQGSRPDRMDKLILSADETELLTYELCVDDSQNSYSNSAINWISGTNVDIGPMMEKSASKATSWIETCLSHHKDCWVNKNAEARLPTIILDVGLRADDSEVRLVQTHSDMKGHYVYLSSPWGSPAGQDTTTCGTVGRMKIIPLEDWPSTCVDAVRTTRRLGLRYLWIDRYCIVQDDYVHKAVEITRMPEYIRNAFLVLVIASGDHSSGFCQDRSSPLLEVDIARSSAAISKALHHPSGRKVRPESGYETTKDVSKYDKTRLFIRRPLETASHSLGERVLKRAWMTQEVVLPQRMLIVGKEQLYWHCRTSLLSEGSQLTLDPFMKLNPRSKTPSGPGRSFFPWYSLINTYSASAVTVFCDKLLALKDIAIFFDSDIPLMEGLWPEDFRNGILWYAKSSRKLESDHTVYDLAMYLPPSWSWLSLGNRRALYNLAWGAQHDRMSAHHKLSLLHIEAGPLSLDSWDYTREHLSEAYAEVRATLFPASALSDKRDCMCFFDSFECELQWLNGSCQVLFMLVCDWNPTPLKDSHGAFGLGLILADDPRRRHSCEHRGVFNDRMNDVYARVGLFLMPDWENKAGKGVRRDIILV